MNELEDQATSDGERSASAGDHEWREIVVRIAPVGDHATVSVHTRRRRGLAVVWERRLGSVGVLLSHATDTTSRELLLACADQLRAIADRLPE